MSSKANIAPTMRQIDLTLARALIRAREIARRVEQQEIPVRTKERTRTPGPHTYKRMSVGELSMAALGGVAVYHWSQQEQGFFESELNNRGFDESLATWRDPNHDLPIEEEALATDRFDHLSETVSVVTPSSLDGMAAAVDEVVLGGDGRVPGALPPVEVIEDMQITGADADAIAAYEIGVGTSAVSPSEQIDAQATDALSEELVVDNELTQDHDLIL
ncbi:hypothetical protein ACXZ66_04115 [Corynebacterium sp. S7]